jgi:predicted RNA-binding Zn-ribbon protein involved in translation (DUF1610 family)
MATTLTEPVAKSDELAYASFGIVKFEKDANGDLYVLGKASDDSVDSDEQIVDSKWMQKAVQDWLSTGANVRVQHNSQRDPAGVGVEAYTEKDGSTWVKSLVVEPIAKTLVEKGVLRAYSVGIARPKIMRDSVARGGRIVDGELCEISLVDRPANKNCGIQLVKSASDGAAEYVDELFGPEDVIKELKDATEETLPAVINKLQSTVDSVLNKAMPGETIALELPKDVSVSFSPADLAKLLAHRAVAEERVAAGELVEKRKMDPDVGGGVDRDKIPASDFAGRDRSFPIVTPGDVSDAASSIGRAGPGNYSTDELKRNIIRIARRKGPSFVAELPESWKKEMDSNKSDEGELEKGKKGKKGKKPAFDGAAKPFGAKDDAKEDEAKPDATKGKKPFPGAHESFGPEHQPPHTEHDDKVIARRKKKKKAKKGDGEPDTVKASKDCPKCGAAFHADSKLRRCDKCHAKLPKADKAFSGALLVKKDRVHCQGCGAMVHDVHNFCPECGNSLAGAPAVNKNHDFRCLGCDHDLDKGEKFCPNCGDKNPGYLPMADSKVKAAKSAVITKKKKKGKPTPGEGVVGPAASNISPVPAHREPDGAAIEAFEHDADLPTDPDRAAMKAAQRHVAAGAPSDLATLHDHLCSAFDPADVAKCYPTDAISMLSVGEWQEKAFDSAASDPVEKAQEMTRLWQHAVTLKSADPEVIAEIRAEAYKNFRDAHPGPGSFPTPMELNPTHFRRTRIESGHAEYSPAPLGSIDGHVPTGHMCADDFNRAHLKDGHAEQSPSNKNQVIEPAPLPPGMGRTYYRNAEREAAKSAMAAMHDHIAQTFPDLCPQSGPGRGGEAPVGERPVPLPVGKSEGAVVEEPSKLVSKAQKLIAKAQKAAEAAGLDGVLVDPAKEAEPVAPAPAFDPEVLKSIVAEATAPLLEQIADQQKILKKQQKRLNALADIPDPREAPFKGLAMQKSMANKSASGVPVAATSVAENAERTQMALMQALQQEARNNPDPAQREAAWNRLYQMTGIRP